MKISGFVKKIGPCILDTNDDWHMETTVFLNTCNLRTQKLTFCPGFANGNINPTLITNLTKAIFL